MAKSPEAEKEKFSVDAALNKKGFAEFLAKHPDPANFDMADEETLKEFFEAFEKSTKLAEELKALYRDQIEKEMDIKLDQKDLASVDVYIEEMAIGDKRELDRLFNRLDNFKELPKEIEGLEKELSEITRNGNADALSSLQGTLEGDVDKFVAARGYLGSIGTIKLFYHTARRFVSERLFDKDYDGIKNLDGKKEAASHLKDKYEYDLAKVGAREVENNLRKQLVNIGATLGEIGDIEGRKKHATEIFELYRKNLFGEMGDIANLKKAIERKAKEELDGLITKTDVKSLELAAQRHKKLSEVSGTTETGIDPLASMNAVEYERQVEQDLKLRISNEVLDKVNKTRLGSDALRKLETSLDDMLKRTVVGTKESDEARQFIVDRLEEAAWQMGQKNDADSSAKRLIINRIIIKYKERSYE